MRALKSGRAKTTLLSFPSTSNVNAFDAAPESISDSVATNVDEMTCDEKQLALQALVVDVRV